MTKDPGTTESSSDSVTSRLELIADASSRMERANVPLYEDIAKTVGVDCQGVDASQRELKRRGGILGNCDCARESMDRCGISLFRVQTFE